MFIFDKKGRTAYLTFVRNLPSQIVLLSPCFFLPRLKTFNWAEVTDVALWFAFFLMSIFAATANVLEFVEEANNREVNLKRVADLRSSGISGCRLAVKLLRLVSIGEWISFITVIFVVYGGIALVVAMVFWSVFPKP